MCGKAFFPASLPFHQKACRKKRQSATLPCRFCDELFGPADMLSHTKRCPARPRGARDRSALASSSPAALSAMQGGKSAGGKREFRVKCAVCGRSFARDRIGKHQKICRSLSWNKESARAFDDEKEEEEDEDDDDEDTNSATYDGPEALRRQRRQGQKQRGPRIPQAIPCELCGKGFFPASMKVRRWDALARQLACLLSRRDGS